MTVQVRWSNGPPPAPKPQVACPFCLAAMTQAGSPARCGACGHDLPPLYMAAMSAATPPRLLPFPVVGLSGHGKTAYLAALATMLSKGIQLWDGCVCQAVTPETQQQMDTFDRCIRSGEMPPPTPVGHDDGHILLVRGLGPWGDRVLLFRDGSGEAFAGMSSDEDHAPALLRSNLIFMFLSLADARSSPGVSTRLMNSLINTLAGGGAASALPGRKLVLILTKADLLDDLPAPLWSYLKSDPLRPLLQEETGACAPGPGSPWLAGYLATLERMSSEAESWFARSAEGRACLELARSHHIEVRVAVVWSTGFPPGEGNRRKFAWRPCRVLDPLFLGLEMVQKRAGV